MRNRYRHQMWVRIFRTMFFESHNKSNANECFIIILKLIKNDNSYCYTNVQKIKHTENVFYFILELS